MLRNLRFLSDSLLVRRSEQAKQNRKNFVYAHNFVFVEMLVFRVAPDSTNATTNQSTLKL